MFSSYEVRSHLSRFLVNGVTTFYQYLNVTLRSRWLVWTVNGPSRMAVCLVIGRYHYCSWPPCPESVFSSDFTYSTAFPTHSRSFWLTAGAANYSFQAVRNRSFRRSYVLLLIFFIHFATRSSSSMFLCSFWCFFS